MTDHITSKRSSSRQNRQIIYFLFRCFDTAMKDFSNLTVYTLSLLGQLLKDVTLVLACVNLTCLRLFQTERDYLLCSIYQWEFKMCIC